MADQKNQGMQDSQSGRTPQGKQSSQTPSSENLKNRDRNKDRDRDDEKLTDLERSKRDAGETRNEERDNIQGRSRTSTTGSLGREQDDEDADSDDVNRRERL